jgi:hypothetical protein
MSISLPSPLRTKIQPIRMRAISSNVSEVLAASVSVYDSVGCDDALTDCILMVPVPFRFSEAGANASKRHARPPHHLVSAGPSCMPYFSPLRLR